MPLSVGFENSFQRVSLGCVGSRAAGLVHKWNFQKTAFKTYCKRHFVSRYTSSYYFSSSHLQAADSRHGGRAEEAIFADQR